jgi:hypothetical protein
MKNDEICTSSKQDGPFDRGQAYAEMRRGKSLFETLAVAAMVAHDRHARLETAITGAWVDDDSAITPHAGCAGDDR